MHEVRGKTQNGVRPITCRAAGRVTKEERQPGGVGERPRAEYRLCDVKWGVAELGATEVQVQGMVA